MSQSHIHYYAGNCLNRLSWLRQDVRYLNQAFKSAQARFVLLNDNNPLCTQQENESIARLYPVRYNTVKAFLPEGPFFLPEDHPGPIKVEEEDAKPALVFLGVDESNASTSTLPERSSSLATDEDTVRVPTGDTYFALDTTKLAPLRDAAIEAASKDASLAKDTQASFLDLRAGVARLSTAESGIASEARQLVDWNRRNRFCAGCGQPTSSVWGGWKRMCRPDPAHTSDAPCISKKGIHNFQYPRVDPVVIMAVVHPNEDQILLGRNKSWPKGFMSCLAGFIEPGESLEEAVKREVFEESGVRIKSVRYHSSQPWPYPSSLMVGCIAVAEEGQQIRLDLDNELEAATFVSRQFVLDALRHRAGIGRHEIKHFEAENQSQKKEANELDPATIRLPPSSAIAHVLIKSWAESEETQSK